MKRTTLTTLALAAAFAGGYTAAPQQQTQPLTVAGEFAVAYTDTSDFLTLAPYHDIAVGYYKQYTDLAGRTRMVAFFDPALLQLREKPTHLMRVTRDGLADDWYTSAPHHPKVTEDVGQRIDFYRVSVNPAEFYGRIDVLETVPADSSGVMYKRWAVEP